MGAASYALGAQGLSRRALLARTDAPIVALEHFTDAVVPAGGRVSASGEAQLVAQGSIAGAVSEVVHVRRLAHDVFGLAPQARPGNARVHTTPSTARHPVRTDPDLQAGSATAARRSGRRVQAVFIAAAFSSPSFLTAHSRISTLRTLPVTVIGYSVITSR